MAARRLREDLAYRNTPVVASKSCGDTHVKILVKELNENSVNEDIPTSSEKKIHTEGQKPKRIRPSRRRPVQPPNCKYSID